MTIMEQREIDRRARDATHELLAERVARGAALLDREMPDWWRADREDTVPWDGVHREPIDLDRLNMDDGGWCVFGQLEYPGMDCAYGEMARRVFGSNANGRRTEAAIQHGVYARPERHYPILTDLWREVIGKRRANA